MTQELPTPATGESKLRRLREVFVVFLRLGLISFGGPVAHLGYFREEIVRRRQWLDDEAYGDLVALCQFLPGPASSQVVFALGMQRAGLAGAITASLCFTLPSALLMILFGYEVTVLGDLRGAGWLHGLKLAAVAVVANAVWGMGGNLCPDWPRRAIGLGAAALLLAYPGAYAQIGVITAGAFMGWMIYRKLVPRIETPKAEKAGAHKIAAGVLAIFLVLLILLPVVTAITGSKNAAVFAAFYRAGSLVFGGGHVVLPLLRAEVVPRGWVNDDTFLAGYGAVQAVPGPLFTFAAYLGTVMAPGRYAWLNGLWCLLAIFLPAWLLIGGMLPFWRILRTKTWAQAALRGANAAVVGVLLAALYNPVWTGGVKNADDAVTAVVLFVLLKWVKLPPWLVVLLAAGAGELLAFR